MGIRAAIAMRLQKLCEERRITINGLAGEAGMPPSTLKNILYGKSKNPGIVTLKLLCDGLGMTLGEFFSSEEFDALDQELK